MENEPSAVFALDLRRFIGFDSGRFVRGHLYPADCGTHLRRPQIVSESSGTGVTDPTVSRAHRDEINLQPSGLTAVDGCYTHTSQYLPGALESDRCRKARYAGEVLRGMEVPPGSPQKSPQSGLINGSLPICGACCSDPVIGLRPLQTSLWQWLENQRPERHRRYHVRGRCHRAMLECVPDRWR